MTRQPNTFTREELAKSRLAERAKMTPIEGRQEQSVVRVDTVDSLARTWRVTLGRLERRDNHAPLAEGDNASPEFRSASFSYACGIVRDNATGVAPIPPRRSGPVLGFTGDVEPVWVEVSWGMGTAQPNRMLANWPAQGGSIVLVGSYVEVFAGTAVLSQTGGGAGDYAQMLATITPAEGGTTEDAGELSTRQLGTIAAETPTQGGAVFYTPDFARRVRVDVVEVVSVSNIRVPLTGNPLVQLVWYDDRGRAIESTLQGAPVGSAFDREPQFHPVPARGVLLGVYQDPADVRTLSAQVHWRIGP